MFVDSFAAANGRSNVLTLYMRLNNNAIPMDPKNVLIRNNDERAFDEPVE